jgi:CBS domain-containing protein
VRTIISPSESSPAGDNPGVESLVIPALRGHAPFDEMEPEALAFLVARLRLAYYPRTQVIVGPHSGRADRLYIIKQGSVRGTGGSADVVLGAGEAFPMGALAGRRATVYTYRAEADSFCWELPEADFHDLMARSARFQAFCTDHLSILLERAHRALRDGAERSLIDNAGMLAPLRETLRRRAVSCPADTPVREVLATMQRERIGSMVVVDPAGAPVGIFTTHDVLERVALPQAPAAAPIISVMTPFPVALEEEATLADAAIAMARHGIRHVVVTRDGRLTGVISERDLFALQRVGLARTAERIRSSSNLESLVAVAADIRELARHLLAHGLAAEPLTALISALNDSLTQRVIELAAARHAMPAAWCWLALGSEGRREQTFVTDQDNALIFSGGEAPLAFAEQVNRDLAACGFPLCKGDIMARNPRWCLRPEAWRAVFGEWIANSDGEALLNASIFFDFRPLAGDARLAGALRESVLAQTRANPRFCRAMAETALQARPPLGLIKDFSADELDLKLLGARPFVDAARVLALGAGSPETSTAARLRAVGETTAVDAFHYIQSLRLRQEGNRIRVAGLNDIDRRVLKGAFRQAALLQERLRMELSL